MESIVHQAEPDRENYSADARYVWPGHKSRLPEAEEAVGPPILIRGERQSSRLQFHIEFFIATWTASFIVIRCSS